MMPVVFISGAVVGGVVVHVFWLLRKWAEEDRQIGRLSSETEAALARAAGLARGTETYADDAAFAKALEKSRWISRGGRA